MREINFKTIKKRDLLNYSDLKEAFKNYLVGNLGYDENEADFVITNDFGDPYDTPFIVQEFDSKITIGRKQYEVRYCYTDFDECGLFEFSCFQPFEFYMLFDIGTLPDTSVISYMNAKRYYLV